MINMNHAQGATTMNNLNQYIDLMLIDEYADKDILCKYSLAIEEIPSLEKQNFLHELLKHDEILNELIDERMQVLIDKRLEEMESKDRDSMGLTVRYHADGDRYVARAY